jgi:hypothetical protein
MQYTQRTLIMPSDISIHDQHSLDTSNDSSDQFDTGLHDEDSEQHQYQSGRPSPLMLSDPLESPSSDMISFDEDDMYGSNSDVETISLRPYRIQQQLQANEAVVFVRPLYCIPWLINPLACRCCGPIGLAEYEYGEGNGHAQCPL